MRAKVASGAHPGAHGVQKAKNPALSRAFVSTATGIRTPVSAVRGRRPSPLDDGGAWPLRVASEPTASGPAGSLLWGPRRWAPGVPLPPLNSGSARLGLGGLRLRERDLAELHRRGEAGLVALAVL